MLDIYFDSLTLIFASLIGFFVLILATKLVSKMIKKAYKND